MCVLPCVYVKESERESPSLGFIKILAVLYICSFLYCVNLFYICSQRFSLSVYLSLNQTLVFRVIKRCAHHAWLQSTCPWFLMVCGTLRACGRRATFSAPPSAHPPATRSATFSHRTPMARRPLFPVFLSALALWPLTHREVSLLFTGCSWNKGGRCRPHQRLAEQNTRGEQNARRKTCGRLQVLTITIAITLQLCMPLCIVC